ncbi:hypothetical protein [Streptomyces sp. Da 82-17]|uniref:hypothetical protein n=1 Tax=Streptomyces sp. Da 82-17 TaxID=3377116 RepID=UPI0038D3AB85
MRGLLPVTAAGLALSACAHPFQDLGPLPPRPTAPAPSAERVVADLTSALAAEGVAVRRRSAEEISTTCTEHLFGRADPATAESDVKAAFARVRSDDGWRRVRPVSGSALTHRKGNWTVTTDLRAVRTGVQPGSFAVTLMCDAFESKRRDETRAPSAPHPPR